MIIQGSARYFPNFYGIPYPIFVDDDEIQPPDPEHRLDFQYLPNELGYIDFSPTSKASPGRE